MEYINKTYRFKLRLTNNQKYRINSWINTCRAIYNLALETKIYAYNSHRVNLSCFDLINQLPELKKEFDWIKDVPTQSFQDVIERLDKAYKSFFKSGGFPKFTNKDRYNSITFKTIKKDTHNRVRLIKIGSVKYFNSQEIKGELRRATIVRESGCYFINILTRQERNPSIHPIHNNQMVGIDMGVTFFASLSNGKQIHNPKHFLKYQNQLRIEQRSLSRKIKDSNNYKKQKLRVNKICSKISATRKDFIHKQSKNIINNFGLIAVEDLKIKNMIKSRNFAKHISDAGWGMFFEQLYYKSNWYGNIFEKVDPKYTSQTCSVCGEVDKMSRINQSKFICTSCGIEQNADINAAKNILVRALTNVRERKALVYA